MLNHMAVASPLFRLPSSLSRKPAPRLAFAVIETELARVFWIFTNRGLSLLRLFDLWLRSDKYEAICPGCVKCGAVKSLRTRIKVTDAGHCARAIRTYPSTKGNRDVVYVSFCARNRVSVEGAAACTATSDYTGRTYCETGRLRATRNRRISCEISRNCRKARGLIVCSVISTRKCDYLIQGGIRNRAVQRLLCKVTCGHHCAIYPLSFKIKVSTVGRRKATASRCARALDCTSNY
jgi:hypothetical protein